MVKSEIALAPAAFLRDISARTAVVIVDSRARMSGESRVTVEDRGEHRRA